MGVDTAAIVAIITSFFGLIGGAFGAWALYKQVVRKTEAEIRTSDNTKEIETVKTEVLAKAATVKAETQAETARMDAILDLVTKQIENLQEENKDQRKEMNDIRAGTDATRTKLDVCLEEKAKESAALHGRLTDLELSLREQVAMTKEEREKREKLERSIAENYKTGLLPDRRKSVKIENATIEGEKK